MFILRDNRLQHSKTDCFGIGLPFHYVFTVLTILRQELLQYTSTVVAVLPVCTSCSWDSLHSPVGEGKYDINYLTTTEVSLLIRILIAYISVDSLGMRMLITECVIPNPDKMAWA